MKNSLQHFGILGMKWGVRRSKEQSSQGVSPKTNKKLIKADAKYLKGKEFANTFFKVHNHGVNEMNDYIAKKGGTIDPKNKKEMAEYTKKYQDSLNNAAKTLGIGVSPSGRYSLEFVVSSEGQPFWNIIDNN